MAMVSAEADLVDQARAGDREAFAELYARYRDSLLRFCRARAASTEEAEDLAAETFLRALAGIGRYQQRGHAFSAFLFRIARNAAIDAARGRRETTDLEGVELAGEDDALAWTLAEDARRGVVEAMAGLSARHRLVLSLRFFQDRSYEETARELDLPVGAVRSLQHRALTALRERLAA